MPGGDSENSEEPVYGGSEVDLNRVPQMFGEDLIPFEQAINVENVNWMLTEYEMDEGKANTVDLEAVSYMEARSKARNALTWAGIATASPWKSYDVVSQPTDDGSIYKV